MKRNILVTSVVEIILLIIAKQQKQNENHMQKITLMYPHAHLQSLTMLK